MSEFDYTIHKVVGIVRKENPPRTYAKIYVLGYINDTYHFVTFSNTDKKEIFCNKGFVHYSSAREKYFDKLILFDVYESDLYAENPNMTRFYVKNTGVDFYPHTPVININENELIGSRKISDSYYNVDGKRIYKFLEKDTSKGVGKSWKLDEDFFARNIDNVIRNENDVYIIKNDIEDQSFSYEDIYDESQTFQFISGIISKYKINPRSEDIISDDLIKLTSIPEKILQNRFDRYLKILEYTTLTYDNIMQISQNTLLSDVLQRSIKVYESEYVKLYEKRNKDHLQQLEKKKEDTLKKHENELLEIERSHSKRMEDIDQKIETKKILLQEINLRISSQIKEEERQNKRLTEIESRKDRLLEDFSVIREVIGGGVSLSTKPVTPLSRSIENCHSQGIEITTKKEFVRVLAGHLLKSGIKHRVAENIFRLIVGRNQNDKNIGIILFPTLRALKPVLRTIGQYNILSVSVAPRWSSYEDLYHNGLSDMIDSAISNSNRIHILLLQNMNLSYIPSYMQPINDCLCGLSNTLPTNNGRVEYPSNLFIFGTRTTQEAISVKEEEIELYGCLDNIEYNEEANDDINVGEGFISMTFIEEYREELYPYKSSPNTYVD